MSDHARASSRLLCRLRTAWNWEYSAIHRTKHIDLVLFL
jgi:hypothetical protein